MDVSFSAWRQVREESLVLKGESFAFLFDRRYTNRLNRMSRVFFEAYAKATKELASQEDRFPSLSEIDAKMESGAVYAFKDRLMKNTEFFEEVKISGVSYLVPRALRFIDASGVYSGLSFDFDAGTVTLPTRRKIPALVEEPQLPKEDAMATQTQVEAPEQAEISQEPASQPVDVVEAKSPSAEAYPGHMPEPYAEVEEVTEVQKKEEPVPVANPPSLSAPEPKREEPAQPVKGSGKESKGKGRKIPTIAIAFAIIVLMVASGAYYFFLSLPPPGTPSLVEYTAYISNTSNDTYLGLDIKNPDGIINELEMMLPQDIDKSISAQGGIVTISHSSGTLVKLNTSSHDAGVRIYLSRNWTSVPVTLNLDVPNGFDSGLVVHGKDYNVARKDDTIVLKFDCTREGINFEQSYTKKR